MNHKALAITPIVAAAALALATVVFAIPQQAFAWAHNHHHNHNSKLRGSQIGSFPIMTKAQFLKSSQGERTKYLFMRHPLTILFGYIFVFLYGMCLYPFLNHPQKHYDCLIALVVHVRCRVIHVLCPAQLSGRVFQ